MISYLLKYHQILKKPSIVLLDIDPIASSFALSVLDIRPSFEDVARPMAEA
jgi:hypothetical protein